MKNGSARRGLEGSLVISLLISSLAPTLVAQEATSPTAIQHSLPGTEMPRYQLVSQFFSMALGPCRAGTTLSCQSFLTTLGLDPDSPAADAVRQALDRYVEVEFGAEGLQTMGAGGQGGTVLVGRPSATDGTPTEMVGDVAVDELERARALGSIYRDLGGALAASGSSLDTIERYIDQVIAPNTVIHSDQPMGADHRIWALDAAFEESLQDAEAPQP